MAKYCFQLVNRSNEKAQENGLHIDRVVGGTPHDQGIGYLIRRRRESM